MSHVIYMVHHKVTDKEGFMRDVLMQFPHITLPSTMRPLATFDSLNVGDMDSWFCVWSTDESVPQQEVQDFMDWMTKGHAENVLYPINLKYSAISVSEHCQTVKQLVIKLAGMH